MGFASSPPPLPPIPAPPQATAPMPTPTVAAQETQAAQEAAEEMKKAAAGYNRKKTIIASALDPTGIGSPTLGAKTLLGG